MTSFSLTDSLFADPPLLSEIAFLADLPGVAPAKTARVLHVINGEYYAGAERVQDLLAGGLAAHGFEVAQACLKPGRFAVERQTQSTPLYETPMRNRFDLRPAWKLARLIRQEGFQLIHSHSVRGRWWADWPRPLAASPWSIISTAPPITTPSTPGKTA